MKDDHLTFIRVVPRIYLLFNELQFRYISPTTIVERHCFFLMHFPQRKFSTLFTKKYLTYSKSIYLFFCDFRSSILKISTYRIDKRSKKFEEGKLTAYRLLTENTMMATLKFKLVRKKIRYSSLQGIHLFLKAKQYFQAQIN